MSIEIESLSTDKLKFLLWAKLQDNLHRSDIVDRAKSEEYRRDILKSIEETENEISAIREELIRREIKQ